MSTLKRITWEGRKKPAPPEPTCGTCVHAVPDRTRISNDGHPILAVCPYLKHMVLLSEVRACSHRVPVPASAPDMPAIEQKQPKFEIE